RLLAQREKLLQAHYAEAVPLDLLRQEQQRIASALARIEEQEAATDDQQELVEENLARALELAADCEAAYLSAPPHIRKLLNQAFFRRLWIDDDEHIRSELAPPFDVLLSDRVREAATKAKQTRRETPDIDWSVWEGSFNDNDPLGEPDEVAGLKEPSLVGAAG